MEQMIFTYILKTFSIFYNFQNWLAQTLVNHLAWFKYSRPMLWLKGKLLQIHMQKGQPQK